MAQGFQPIPAEGNPGPRKQSARDFYTFRDDSGRDWGAGGEGDDRV